MTRYTIRYRSCGGTGPVVLIVEDEQGAALLFGGGELQGQFTGTGAVERLVRLVERRAALSPVPEVGPYTLEGLRELVQLPQAPCPAGTVKPTRVPPVADS